MNCAITNAYNRGTMCDFRAHEVHLIPTKFVHGFSKSSAYVATDKKVGHNTGLTNKATFLSLYALLRAKAERCDIGVGTSDTHLRASLVAIEEHQKKSGPRHILQCKDEFTSTLMKLRLTFDQ